MQRTETLKDLKEWFVRLESSMNGDAKLRFQDDNITLECFFCDLLNLIHQWKLIDANANGRPQQDCYDLCDDTNRIAVQVTRDASSSKTKKTVESFYQKKYDQQYDRVIMIYPQMTLKSGQPPKWLSTLPNRSTFEYKNDRLCLGDLLKETQQLSSDHQQAILDYVVKELHPLGKALQYGVDQNIQTLANVVHYMSTQSINISMTLTELEPDQKAKLQRFAEHAQFLLSQYQHNIAGYGSIAAKAREAVGIDAARAPRIQAWLKTESLAALDKHDNNAKLAFQYLRDLLLKETHISGNDGDSNAVSYLLADEFLKCNVFPNPPKLDFLNDEPSL